MNNHKKTKHPELLEGQPKRGRGRPRKYPPKAIGDFESTKYEVFFNNPPRCPEEGKNIDVHNVVIQVFDFIYNEGNKDKLFSHPEKYEDNPILKNLYNDAPVSDKPRNQKVCDEVFMNIFIILNLRPMKNISHSWLNSFYYLENAMIEVRTKITKKKKKL